MPFGSRRRQRCVARWAVLLHSTYRVLDTAVSRSPQESTKFAKERQLICTDVAIDLSRSLCSFAAIMKTRRVFEGQVSAQKICRIASLPSQTLVRRQRCQSRLLGSCHTLQTFTTHTRRRRQHFPSHEHGCAHPAYAVGLGGNVTVMVEPGGAELGKSGLSVTVQATPELDNND